MQPIVCVQRPKEQRNWESGKSKPGFLFYLQFNSHNYGEKEIGLSHVLLLCFKQIRYFQKVQLKVHGNMKL
jgi:hypothetical protein